ncbi:Tigger transposable element-derived protein 4-like [Oopsacas minuta]|uniref:Tigger transposable element-derived protein 4-like n=1 Tax=Oopsacas minuta TaxID=111878 RepID=A0AAV7KGQ4_9METZ|nr:Tigger transposable element-derived protein 4-like [Oopsacas minuta]
MTSEIFEKWLRKLNNSMRFDDRKIAKILDNFSGHPNLNLSHIKLFFLPPNTTSMTQPMDAGIIKNLKHHYRRFLVRKRLLAVDSETGFKLDLLQALDWLKMSWDNVTPTTIKHCYQHVGFKDLPATEETSAPDTSIWSSAEEAGLVSDGLSFEDFVALDDGVAIGPGEMVSKLTISLIVCTLQVMTMLISKMTTMNIPSISMFRHSTLLSHALTPL